MISNRTHQTGSTLLVTLVMLIVLTLFAIAMITASGLSLKIVGNFQQRKIMESGAMQEIDKFISNAGNFSIDPAVVVAVPAAACVNGLDSACTEGYHVLISAPTDSTVSSTCIKSTIAPGESSLKGAFVKYNNDWEVAARVVDPTDHSKQYMKIVQGVRIKMLAECP
jgi:Tfp pilus assembly protein PilX